MLIAYVHHLNTNNVGDLMSAPYIYFHFSGNSDGKLYDLWANSDSREFDVAIFGGGAIAGNLLTRNLHYKTKAKKRIAWGVGRTIHSLKYHSELPHEYPDGFDLLGVRDWFSPMPKGAVWVPCASCMHPLFDQDYPITREAVGYFNFKRPIPRHDIPEAATNAQLIDTVIPFLASAETVVTNSYHGVYWATLLGRKVVMVDAYSSKFFDLRWPHVSTHIRDWRSAKSVNYPGALSCARGANEEFYLKVAELLGNE